MTFSDETIPFMIRLSISFTSIKSWLNRVLDSFWFEFSNTSYHVFVLTYLYKDQRWQYIGGKSRIIVNFPTHSDINLAKMASFMMSTKIKKGRDKRGV